MMRPVIDNVTLVQTCSLPSAFATAAGQPVEWQGVLYSPRYAYGAVQRYEAQVRNLRLVLYPDKVYLANSLHKFAKGNNWSDFTLSDLRYSSDLLFDQTGMDWRGATVKKLEYGCNIPAHASKVVSSLRAYKGKDYLPMHSKGKRYGAAVELADYRIKGYDKTFEVQRTDKLTLKTPLFRWEVAHSRMRGVEKLVGAAPLTLAHLQQAQTWEALAADAVKKYQSTIRMQQLNYSELSTHEQAVIAVMLNPEIRENLKMHHKKTYERYRGTFNKLMADKRINPGDCTAEQLAQKFRELIGS